MEFKYGQRFYPLYMFVVMMSWILCSIFFLSVTKNTSELLNSKVLLVLLGTPIIIAVWMYHLIKSIKAKKNPGVIILAGDHITFPDDNTAQKRVVKYDDIEKMWTVNLSDSPTADRRQTTIVTSSKQKYSFEEAKFRNKNEYERFTSRLRVVCKNISAE